jgi:anaerobic sulfite reductase subunit A
MGYLLTEAQADSLIEKLRDKYEIWAPVLFPGTGRFSETDVVRYDAVKKARDVVFDKKSDYSFKAAILPPNTTMFYFTEDSVTVPAVPEKDRLVFVRSCDMNAVRRLDQIYLNNKFADSYYAAMREKVHFVLMGCPQSFENCFCVSMGTNTCEGYGAYVTPRDGGWYFDCSDPDVRAAVEELGAETREEAVEYVTENEVRVTVPDNLSPKVRKSHVWDEYDKRCIGCGRCNFACPTCTCFTTQDIFYKDNAKVGEAPPGVRELHGGRLHRHRRQHELPQQAGRTHALQGHAQGLRFQGSLRISECAWAAAAATTSARNTSRFPPASTNWATP